MDQDQLSSLLFPHDSIRKEQDKMVKGVWNALENKKNLVVHAPTGIGKTVSALAPALSYALKNDLIVFFLTSRQTQHAIAIDTLKKIKEKHETSFTVVDLIAKKGMCLQDVEGMPSSDFLDYCKKLRDKDHCNFYLNTKKKSQLLTVSGEHAVSELKVLSPVDVHELVSYCKKPELCPYEVSASLARDAQVVIADYNIVFHPNIRDSFFARSDIKLENCIVVVDEGHNLPSRCRDVLTTKLSTVMVERAISEAEKFGYTELAAELQQVLNVLKMLGNDLEQEEGFISAKEFVSEINEYDELIAVCNRAADDIRESQKQSYIGSIGEFLEKWRGEDHGFTRILRRENEAVVLHYKCLDPSLLTKDVIDRSYSTILMSGTLTPTEMYSDVLGFSNEREYELENPFPPENKLSLIVPETTTKFSQRSDAQYKHIADICSKVIAKVPGNVALFFPSYFLRDQVYKHLYHMCKRTMFIEKPMMSKQDKEQIISQFKECKDKGGVLLGVAAGSFGEGVDLPGDLLKGVVVIGLPLEKPDLETKELIDYFQDAYGRGMDYGYVFPAFTKCLQNAGRCIRSENDKGIIVFLDERFAWPMYMRCFPEDMDVKITKMFENRIEEFFKS